MTNPAMTNPETTNRWSSAPMRPTTTGRGADAERDAQFVAGVDFLVVDLVVVDEVGHIALSMPLPVTSGHTVLLASFQRPLS